MGLYTHIGAKLLTIGVSYCGGYGAASKVVYAHCGACGNLSVTNNGLRRSLYTEVIGFVGECGTNAC